jgi:hypothetical protein
MSNGPKPRKKLPKRRMLPGGDIGSESHFDLEYYPGEGKITYEDWLKKMDKINKEDMLKKIQKINGKFIN